MTTTRRRRGGAFRPGKAHLLNVRPDLRARGERHGQHVLTDRDVRALRDIYSSGDYSLRELGEIFGVCHTTVLRAMRRVTWTHVSDERKAAA